MTGAPDGRRFTRGAMVGPYETAAERGPCARIDDRHGRGRRRDPDRHGTEADRHSLEERAERVTDGRLDVGEAELATLTIADHLERRRRRRQHAAVAITDRRDTYDARRRVDPDPIPVTANCDGPTLLARRECRARSPSVQ